MTTVSSQHLRDRDLVLPFCKAAVEVALRILKGFDHPAGQINIDYLAVGYYRALNDTKNCVRPEDNREIIEVYEISDRSKADKKEESIRALASAMLSPVVAKADDWLHAQLWECAPEPDPDRERVFRGTVYKEVQIYLKGAQNELFSRDEYGHYISIDKVIERAQIAATFSPLIDVHPAA